MMIVWLRSIACCLTRLDISGTGSIVPISLFANITLTMMVPVPDGADYLVGIDEPVLVDGQIGHLEPELLQLVAGVQHGVVLDRGGDDVISKVT